MNPPRALIAEAVNVVIYIAGRGRKRHIETIARVTGHDSTGYHLVAMNGALDTPFPELSPPSPLVPSPSPPPVADPPSSTLPGALP